MIITHAVSAHGQRRLYLGGKSSLECWIEPAADGTSWSFHLTPAPTSGIVSPEQQRQAAIQYLLALADELHVPPENLKAVAFEAIAALHTGNAFDNRRTPVPRRMSNDHAFMATPPNITRPKADFDAHSRTHQRNRQTI